MDKKYFVLKLIPGRVDFAQTMTVEEKIIMQQHVAYWKDNMDKGSVLVFGPVLDPKGVYGLGIVSAVDEEEINTFIAADPATAINLYEYYPMRAVVKE
jgi:uncharacterized protein YciI